jgi:hypothetical protein
VETLFLPFDWSDQGTGMLRVRFESDAVLSLNVGWCSLEGYLVNPSQLSTLSAPPGFHPQLPKDVVVLLQELHNALVDVIDSLS